MLKKKNENLNNERNLIKRTGLLQNIQKEYSFAKCIIIFCDYLSAHIIQSEYFPPVARLFHCLLNRVEKL